MKRDPESNRRVRIRQVGLTLSLLAGTVMFGREVNKHYPISKWLLWSYLEYWLLSVVFMLACWGAGDAISRRLMPRLPASERVIGALVLGVVTFFCGMFGGGILGLYGPIFFVALPLIMIFGAGRPFFRFVRRLGRHVLGASRRRSPSLTGTLSALFGFLGVGMLYFLVLTPDNVAYDSHWYHLGIAEHYAAQGSVRAFPEGFYLAAVPHLASFVYTWAFLLPGSDLFDRIELSAHLEFIVFLWTLASIPVLVRVCTRRALLALPPPSNAPKGPRGSGASTWVALFLFPGILLYDSSLIVAADHVNAFWAIPIVLSLFRFFRAPGVRAGISLAVPMSGALLTKYQSSYLVTFPVIALLSYVAWAIARRRPADASRVQVVVGTLSTAIAGLVLTSPHWLKNWIWHGDPIYPFLHRHLHDRPWTVDSANLLETMFIGQGEWIPHGTTGQKLAQTLEAVPTFSFQPHDWYGMHGHVPVFGSLFTLCVVPLLFFRRTLRIWFVVIAAHVGVFVWYWTFHQDRYLQCLVPWMATAVAATCRLAWASGLWGRICLSLLVAFQIVWGGDVYFIPTHAMLGGAPQKAVVALMSSGYQKMVAKRRQIYGALALIGRNLRPGSKVLVHDSHMHLGLGAMAVLDCGPWQGGISYGRNRSPGMVYDQLHGFGVTHIIWNENREYDSLAGDFVFYAFVSQYARPQKAVSGIKVALMPRERPPERSWLGEMAAVYVCGGKYQPGQYLLGDLTVPGVGPAHYPPPRKTAEDAGGNDEIVRTSTFLALEPSCHPEVTVAPGYKLVQSRGKTQLWIKGAPFKG